MNDLDAREKNPFNPPLPDLLLGLILYLMVEVEDEIELHSSKYCIVQVQSVQW